MDDEYEDDLLGAARFVEFMVCDTGSSCKGFWVPVASREGMRASLFERGFDWGEVRDVCVLRASERDFKAALATSVASIYRSLADSGPASRAVVVVVLVAAVVFFAGAVRALRDAGRRSVEEVLLLVSSVLRESSS